MTISKGFCILAQNNSKTDYVRQAYALALSLHKFNPNEKITLITNDKITKKQEKVFDNVIKIPWTDQADTSDWKIENRWKIYHASPYNETIVMDADMLILEKIDHWWSYLKDKELYFTSRVKTYRNETVTSRAYRKAFDSNNLPDLYSAVYYFKKSKTAHEFFELLEIIMTNWELFYGKYAPIDYQKWCSVDVSVAIAAKILGYDSSITDKLSPITFTHMKPKLQNWKASPDKWTSAIDSYFNKNNELIIGNFVQTDVFHYVEDEFLTDKILKRLEL